LLDQLVEIHTKQLKHQAQVLSVDKGVLEAQKMMVIVLVELGVELCENQQRLQSNTGGGRGPLPNQAPTLPSCSD